jgi:hypothetical protein
MFGYKLAIIRWQPKDLITKIENYININIELSNNVKRLDDLNKQKDISFIQQLNSLGFYFKEKYNDNYIFDQMNRQIPGYQIKENEKKELNLDDILDKASEYGLDSLTKEEMDYLKKNN